MARLPDYSKVVRDLPDRERYECLHLGRLPQVLLAEKIGHFDPPFQYLLHTKPGFDPEIRFILNECIVGDSLARRVRDALILKEKLWRREPLPTGIEDLWRELFTKRDEDFKSFIEVSYPWRAIHSKFDERNFQRDPRLDEYFTDAVLQNIGSFGFKRLARSFKSGVLSRSIQLKWDKGTWSLNMAVWVVVPTLAIQERIGLPFCGSAGSFDHSVAANVEKQLHLFFAEYGKIFPDVLAALDEGMRAQEAWLTRHAV